MAVWNLGSINEDRFYRLRHLPEAGETLTTTAHSVGLGGKGANQSVAVALAGSRVHHIGQVGPGGEWAKDRLAGMGVDVTHVSLGSVPTGHANVHVGESGENMIVIFPGANRELDREKVRSALSAVSQGDVLLLQNETNLTQETAEMARAAGMFIIYSAAPFEAGPTEAVLPLIDLLVLNEIEAAQLGSALGRPPENLPVPSLLVTRGEHGARWLDHVSGQDYAVPAFPVGAVDTTGAGDCYVGYLAAGMDQGLFPDEAMRLAAAAAALQVTRRGTSEAIPKRAEVEAFLAGLET